MRGVMRVQFNETRMSRSVRTNCRKCGKTPLTRTVSEYETENPWNKNAAGIPKTKAEIVQSVSDKLDAKCQAVAEAGVLCKACRDSS